MGDYCYYKINKKINHFLNRKCQTLNEIISIRNKTHNQKTSIMKRKN